MKKSLGPHTFAPPAPVWVIGTYDPEGKPNVMTASWAGICCSKPPCVSVALRKATKTYGSLEARRAFSVSIPSEAQVSYADYFGVASGKDVDKFDRSGLTPVRSEKVDAPYVGEFPLILECTLVQSVALGLHTLFVGEILDVKAEESLLNKDGRPDFEKLKPILFDPVTFNYFRSAGFLYKGFSCEQPPPKQA